MAYQGSHLYPLTAALTAHLASSFLPSEGAFRKPNQSQISQILSPELAKFSLRIVLESERKNSWALRPKNLWTLRERKVSVKILVSIGRHACSKWASIKSGVRLRWVNSEGKILELINSS